MGTQLMDMGAAGRKKLTPEHKRNISLGLRRNKDSLGLRPYSDTTWEHTTNPPAITIKG